MYLIFKLILFQLFVVTASTYGICGDASSLYNGTWKFGDKIEVTENKPYSTCPQTLYTVQQNWAIRDHPQKWSCMNKTYIAAEFQSSSCHTLSLKDSFRHIGKTHITFLGDSLIGQLYIASMCAAEKEGISSDHLEFHYLHETLLRSDLPCAPRCITDAAYRNQSLLIHPCFACFDGIKRHFEADFYNLSKFWPLKVLHNTSALILGAGAWYNAYRSLINASSVYNDTLQKIGPFLGKLKKERGINVFWLDLPPMANQSLIHPDFGWQQFLQYNQAARFFLEPFGVIYLDTSSATRIRKYKDPNITDSSFLHWCNPGRDTVPLFQARSIFHILAVDALQKKNNLNTINTTQQQSHKH